MRLLPATSVMLLSATASFAAEPFHVAAPSFGCVDARSTWLLSETHDRRRHDPQWVERAMHRGQCSLVGPAQEWQEIGPVGHLVLMRPISPQAGPPLLFRPFDLRRGPPTEQVEPLPPVVSAPATSPVPGGAATGLLPASVSVAPPVAIPPAVPLPGPPDPARPADVATSPAGPVSTGLPPAAPAPVPEPASPMLAALPPVPATAAAATNPLQAAWAGRPAIIGGIALVLAALIVLGLRRLIRHRVVKRHKERSVDEWLDTQPAFGTDRLDTAAPAIDDAAYRQRCVKSLGEAGWQARMSLPAGRLTADIIARRDGCLLTVQCRPSMQPLEAAVVQEALVVRSAQDAQLAAVVSNAGYTEAARTLANANGVRLLHETELPEFTS